MLIRAGKIYCEKEVIENGTVEIKEGKILGIYRNPLEDEVLDMGDDSIIIPGFIDNHTHGGYGIDLTTAKGDEIRKFALEVAKEGTTAFLTTIGAKNDEIMTEFVKNSCEYMENMNIYGSEVLGLHLEGPFLNAKHAGLQELSSIDSSCAVEQILKWCDIAGDKIKIMTVAPEVESMDEIIPILLEKNILPSAGHTDATYENMVKGKKMGVQRVTHLFNGMRGLHHREPGIIGFTLEDGEMMAEMAGFDTYSIVPEIWKMVYRLKGAEKMIITTDSGFIKGLPDGVYKNGERVLEIKGGRVYTPYQGGGMHPGVPMKFIDCFKNVLKYTGATLEEAILMSSVNPAKEIGIFDRKGSLTPGKDADILVLDNEMNIKAVYCRGDKII